MIWEKLISYGFFFLESDSGNHDLISQNPLIHILIFLNIQNL
ncbi:hypothetical protein RUMLAC_01071 [[Ruminococcus] lactaris ATCC 29176]|uniref:Uncharacterized protein n=1 Tax=[Ruminococcus] lactaris ATCC 29176 TaxID=471875 RepID=B5CNN1_9FIRM|nr:hypothetical protein RUMLAC_01071 [[Ruminococcus] lactaris ATCC 29176]